ncbi:MAG TPA: elongation factor G [Candidatus Kapabacteria bacterium]|nr:elongation factor G [Candidatus Kapabacteria bacterium]
MKVYETKDIRNLALVGHAGSGKTTLSEALLFQSGAITRKGTIEDRNTISDYNEIEHERGSSVFSTLLFAELNNCKLNLLDTPGYDDYIGEMIAAQQVCDSTAVVLNANNSIELGAENGLSYAEKLEKPTFIIINKIDNEQAKFDELLQELKSQYGNRITAFQFPVNPGSSFDTIIDLILMKTLTYKGNNEPEISDIPASLLSKAETLKSELIESIAESDEGLMNIYFEEGYLNEEQIKQGLKNAYIKREIFPVFCTSGKNFVGINSLVQFIVDVVPNPAEIPTLIEEGSVKVACDSASKLSLFVFKMYSDQKLGDLTYFKVKSGKLHSGMDLVNETKGSTERLGGIYVINGKKRDEISELYAGDIGGTVKLKGVLINDTLHEKGFNVKFPNIQYPNTKIRSAIIPKIKGEEEKVGIGLNSLQQEDPSIYVEHSPELKQTIVHAMGELHLQVIKWRLEHRYKVEVEFIAPKVPYRETIQKKVTGSYRHKKQSGGAGQFAEVHMLLEPWYEGLPNPTDIQVRGKEIYDMEWGGKLEFLNCIVGGVIDQRFMPAILKGVMDKMHEGPLTGSYVRDIRVAVYDGKMHPVDSNEAAFKTAGMMVFKENFTQASPKILEPVYDVEIRVPEDFVGDVMSDLPARRGVILGIDSDGRYQIIKAQMPLAEVDKYSQALRSISQARATFNSKFAKYAPVPPNIQQELIDTYKKLNTEQE